MGTSMSSCAFIGLAGIHYQIFLILIKLVRATSMVAAVMVSGAYCKQHADPC